MDPIQDSLKARRKKERIVDRFTGKIQILQQEHAEGIVTDEEFIDHTNNLRDALIEELVESDLGNGNAQYVQYFENLVYTTITQKLQRYFAYYKAAQKATARIDLYNQELGDHIIDVDTDADLAIIRRVDDIHTTKILLEGLQMDPVFSERIVNHMIDAAFKPSENGLKMREVNRESNKK